MYDAGSGALRADGHFLCGERASFGGEPNCEVGGEPTGSCSYGRPFAFQAEADRSGFASYSSSRKGMSGKYAGLGGGPRKGSLGAVSL